MKAMHRHLTAQGIRSMSEFQRWKFYRENPGFQRRVAETAGVTQSTVSKWLAGQYKASEAVETATNKVLASMQEAA